MRLEKAALEPLKGLDDSLRKVGRGERRFRGVPGVTDGQLTVRAYPEPEVVWSHGEDLPADYVAHTAYRLVDENEASIRVIESNGGVIEDGRMDPDTKHPYRRYWLDLGR